MSSIRSAVTRYHHETSSLLYSYLISLPLLLLYEVLISVSQPNTGTVVRVSVDIWIRTLFSYFSNNVISILLIVVAVVGLIILYIERKRLRRLKLRYFLYMLAESVGYALLLAVLLSSIVTLLFQFSAGGGIQSLTKLQKLALSLGAGIYEELFFRVLLVSALLVLFKQLIPKKKASLFAIIIAALLFSAVHYVGAYGDNFSFSSFLFRFLFGIGLNILYIKRGFGIAAWTHAFYDAIVIIFRTKLI